MEYVDFDELFSLRDKFDFKTEGVVGEYKGGKLYDEGYVSKLKEQLYHIDENKRSEEMPNAIRFTDHDEDFDYVRIDDKKQSLKSIQQMLDHVIQDIYDANSGTYGEFDYFYFYGLTKEYMKLKELFDDSEYYKTVKQDCSVNMEQKYEDYKESLDSFIRDQVCSLSSLLNYMICYNQGTDEDLIRITRLMKMYYNSTETDLI